MPLLAVPVAGRNTNETRALLQQAAAVADVVELRLDMMGEFDLPALLQDRPCPVIVTYRPQREGGQFHGAEEDRLHVLRQAADLGAEYIDVEWDAVERFTHQGTGGDARVIVSRHDFVEMPNLALQAHELAQRGADIVKVVGMASRLAHSVAVLNLLARFPKPLIAIAMGPAGVPARLLALRQPGCFLTFAAFAVGAGSAPGQAPAALVRRYFHPSRWDPDTRLIGLLGPGAENAPALERGNAWLQTEGINAVLAPCPPGSADTGGSALGALAAMGVDACVVTDAWETEVASSQHLPACKSPHRAWTYKRPAGWHADIGEDNLLNQLLDILEAG